MSEENNNRQENNNGSGFWHYVIRLIIAVIVLALTSFFTPGFKITGLWPMILAAIVITVIDIIVENLFHFEASPFGNGFKGFVITAIILYVTQFIVPDMNVTVLGAIIAAIVIGIIDAIIPGRAF